MTPTQAQIDAAAKVLNVSYENMTYSKKMAKAALTAAAEVGEVCITQHLWQHTGAAGSMGKEMICERCGKRKWVQP